MTSHALTALWLPAQPGVYLSCTGSGLDVADQDLATLRMTHRDFGSRGFSCYTDCWRDLASALPCSRHANVPPKLALDPHGFKRVPPRAPTNTSLTTTMFRPVQCTPLRAED